jgi:hypothetical protein
MEKTGLSFDEEDRPVFNQIGLTIGASMLAYQAIR